MRPEDQPSQTPPQVSALLVRAHGIGPAAGAIADAFGEDAPRFAALLAEKNSPRRSGGAPVEG